MKLLRYGAEGSEKPAIMDQEGNIRDLSDHISDISGCALLSSEMDKLRALDLSALPIVKPKRIGACVGNVGKFICVGLNYADHAKETQAKVPSQPVLFSKFTSAICGPDDDVIMPPGAEKLDWEVELGIIIGKPGNHISEENALDHIAGLCLINDLSERHYQLECEGQWVKGKGCDTFGPTGPYLVTLDEINDLNNLTLNLSVNGHAYQKGNTSNLIYKIPFLISYISRFCTLKSGDIISTGTPAGVGLGQKPNPIYLKIGDVMELSIDGLGSQRQVVVSD